MRVACLQQDHALTYERWVVTGNSVELIEQSPASMSKADTDGDGLSVGRS